MPKLRVLPASALITQGQAVTFQAVDDANQAVSVTWTLTPQLGNLIIAPSAPPGQASSPQSQGSSSTTYVAPAIVQTAQTIAVSATSATDTASVTISLTPDAISIMPTAVELHANQKQKFEAIVASGASEPEPITWILAPQVGSLDDTGLYTAPDTIPDDGLLIVTAASKRLGMKTSAKVTLSPEPWHGFGTVLLGSYLFLVFSVVYLMMGLWPSEVPNIDALKADQAQAQSNLDKSKLALQTALASGAGYSSPTAQPTPGGSPAKPMPSTITTDSAQRQASDSLLEQLEADLDKARQELDEARRRLSDATSPTVGTRLVRQFNREIDLLCLVLLAGALGSFLHMAQSFSDFAGNRRLKASWVWWYCFLPFVGGGLALVFYAALRGGLMTVGSTPTVKSADLNPYGLVAAAAFAGMFSKAATKKLGEVFDTVFQLTKGQQTKDPLKPVSSNVNQPVKPSAAGSGGASAPTEQPADQQSGGD